MGHNTSFLPRVACNVIYISSQLADLATSQQEQSDLYGYKRFPLIKAFHRLMNDDITEGATSLDRSTVQQAAHKAPRIDGQISFDRALLYA